MRFLDPVEGGGEPGTLLQFGGVTSEAIPFVGGVAEVTEQA